MHILLVTPLYPPDLAQPAPYVKELAARLLPAHEVTVLTYGQLPEKISGVQIIAVDKRRLLPVRLIIFTWKLLWAIRAADVVYVENGASVELPVSIVSLFVRRPTVIHMGDKPAQQHAEQHLLRRALAQFVQKHAHSTLTEVPPTKPEILPFMPRPDATLAIWEHSWQQHLERLQKIFDHV